MQEQDAVNEIGANLPTAQNLVRWLDNLGIHSGDDVSYIQLLGLLIKSGKEAIHETAIYVTGQLLDRNRTQREYVSPN